VLHLREHRGVHREQAVAPHQHCQRQRHEPPPHSISLSRDRRQQSDRSSLRARVRASGRPGTHEGAGLLEAEHLVDERASTGGPRFLGGDPPTRPRGLGGIATSATIVEAVDVLAVTATAWGVVGAVVGA
jgi:hypothetical protein